LIDCRSGQDWGRGSRCWYSQIVQRDPAADRYPSRCGPVRWCTSRSQGDRKYPACWGLLACWLVHGASGHRSAL